MTGKRQSIAIIILAWLILQLGGLFSPGLLDDVDSVYIEIAREMLHRHDFVTPTIDGIRFFDKPPLMYWLAAGSMRLLGERDWAARLPLALAFLALLFAIYALGRFLHSERAAFYAALIFATSIGPYLYTRFFIPDILICLWLTLGIHAFLLALSRLPVWADGTSPNPLLPIPYSLLPASNRHKPLPSFPLPSSLLPSLAFATVLALNLLTKGLIGLVFPIAFVLLYLALTRQLSLLPRFHLIPATLLFLLIALPWHILAALRNPAIPMPSGLGLPTRAGWTWFYLYNEHFARFLGRRIPHDYGNTPVWLFWLYALIWMMPWATFLPAAIGRMRPALRRAAAFAMERDPAPNDAQHQASRLHIIQSLNREREAALTTILLAGVVLIFFTFSSRQEYYSLPALPALALMIGSVLATAELAARPSRAVLACHRWLLLPIASLVGATCAFFAITASSPAPGTGLAALLAQNPALYNLSLGHIFDLTGAAMGFFRGPLTAVVLGMLILGPISYILRRHRRAYAANLAFAAGMALVLLAAHIGYVRFNPILGSKDLAVAIVAEEQSHPPSNNQPDLILIDGELTSGSTLLFYTHQPVHLVNGRVNGPWFGSLWPDAPPIFETEASLRRLWAGPNRLFLLTYTPASRTHELETFGPVHSLAAAGGKTILTNR